MASIRDRTPYVVRVYSGEKRAGRPLVKQSFRSERSAQDWIATQGYPPSHVTVARAEERWQVEVRRRGRGTTRRTYPSEAAAYDAAPRLEAEVGDPVQAARAEARQDTLRALLHRYEHKIAQFKPAYRRSEKSRLSILRSHPMANLRVTQVDQTVVQAYVDERQGLASPRDLKPWIENPGRTPRAPIDAESVKREKAVLAAAFEAYSARYGIQHNPCYGLKIARTKVIRNPDGNHRIAPAKRRGDADTTDELATERNRRLRGDEEQRLLTEARRHAPTRPYGAAYIQLAIETATRKSELLRLRWRDVDLAAGTAKIAPSKTDEDTRIIPLTQRAETIFRDLRTLRLASGELDAGEPVIPLTAQQTRDMWEQCRDRAGIEDLHFHDLRHEAASRLIERGLTTEEVMQITRHHDYRSLRRYTHLRPSNLVAKLRGL